MNFSLKETIKKLLENGTEEPICRAGTETQTLRTDVWTQQVRCIESNTEVCTPARVRQTATRKQLHHSGISARRSVRSRRGGREVQEGGDTCILTADSSYCQQQPTTL